MTKMQMAYCVWNWENEPMPIFLISAHMHTESEVTADIFNSTLSEFAPSSAVDGARPFLPLPVAVHFQYRPNYSYRFLVCS
jgi:hypothetical protein